MSNSLEPKRLWEVEQKFRVTHSNAIRLGLQSLSARYARTENHCDTYLRHPCRDFRATDEALRIRTLDGCSVVTYKGPRLQGPVKIRPEIELPLSDGSEGSWLQIWTSLGFEVVAQVKKRRDVYELTYRDTPFIVTLDHVEDLGDYCEIERIINDLELRESAQNQIEELAQHLHVTEVERRSYLGLLLDLRANSKS